MNSIQFLKMDKKKRSHLDNLYLVCLRKTKSFRRISSSQQNIFKQHVYSDYKSSDNRFPKSICNTCSFVLNQKPLLFNKIQVFNHSELIKMKVNNDNVDCSCIICNIARSIPSQISKNKLNPNSRNVRKVKKPEGFLCQKCLTTINRGIKHHCNEKTLQINCENLLTQNSKERLALSNIKKS